MGCDILNFTTNSGHTLGFKVFKIDSSLRKLDVYIYTLQVVAFKDSQGKDLQFLDKKMDLSFRTYDPNSEIHKEYPSGVFYCMEMDRVSSEFKRNFYVNLYVV